MQNSQNDKKSFYSRQLDKHKKGSFTKSVSTRKTNSPKLKGPVTFLKFYPLAFL